MKNIKNKISKKLLKQTGKTINHYKLIKKNDRIIVGLSGGKDSLSLLDLLYLRKQYVPVEHTLIAAYIEIDEIGHRLDINELQKFCDERNLEFIYKKISVDMNKDENKDKCFVCSWHRRKALFKLAEELKCNKLALGHHIDDIIATLFMNMTMQGNISTMPISISLFEGELEIIRPLGQIEENHIIEYSNINKLKIQKHECKFGKNQSREKVTEILSKLYQLNPHVKKNIFRSMSHINKEYLS